MKSRVPLRKLIWYDLRVGTKVNIYRYLFATVILVFISELVLLLAHDNHLSLQLWDLFYQIFEGLPEYTKERESQFQLPVLLMMFQLFMLFTIGSYPKQDICGYGRNVFLESGSRKRWWGSKCVWLCVNIMVYYVLAIFILAICLWVQGSPVSFKVTDSMTFQQVGKNTVSFFGNLLLLPLLVSETMGILQLFIGVFLRPIWGYGVSIALLVISAYKVNPLLIGNYFMMARNRYFSLDGKLSMTEGSIVCLILFLGIMILGSWMMGRYDILNKGD
ncbi:MAG: hypothetical protein PHG16_03950 [Lachnospiraceae bacterium]|nr:hypothetical protein [Lachnospiraceae bacterium]